jgi:integrase
MLVHVRGKGNKDRYVSLPGRTLDLLRAYWATHRHPVFIFPDRQDLTSAKGPMSKRGVQYAFGAALRESGIQKRASVHTLRHSWGRPFGRLVNISLDYDPSPETGLLTLAVQRAKPPWAGQLSGDMGES